MQEICRQAPELNIALKFLFARRTLQQFHIYTGHDTILTFLYSPSSFSSTSMISSLAQSRNSSIIRRRGASGG